MNRRFVVAIAALGSLVLFAAGPVWAQHAGYYVLDGFGGVHAGGGAPAPSPATPYFGFDVAVDIDVVPADGLPLARDGIIVLDRFGGVHFGNVLAANPPSGGTPYFGFDAARAITHVNSTVVYSASVAASGGLVSSWARGVSSTVKLATGKYLVTFARSIEGCNFFAALGDQANATFSTSYNGVAGEVAAYRSQFSINDLVVVTRTSAGALADKPFHILVHC